MSIVEKPESTWLGELVAEPSSILIVCKINTSFKVSCFLIIRTLKTMISATFFGIIVGCVVAFSQLALFLS